MPQLCLFLCIKVWVVYHNAPNLRELFSNIFCELREWTIDVYFMECNSERRFVCCKMEVCQEANQLDSEKNVDHAPFCSMRVTLPFAPKCTVRCTLQCMEWMQHRLQFPSCRLRTMCMQAWSCDGARRSFSAFSVCADDRQQVEGLPFNRGYLGN